VKSQGDSPQPVALTGTGSWDLHAGGCTEPPPASPSQTLVLSGDAGSKDAGPKKEKLDTAVKKITEARDEQRPPSTDVPGKNT